MVMFVDKVSVEQEQLTTSTPFFQRKILLISIVEKTTITDV
jgi:hypothetical protein